MQKAGWAGAPAASRERRKRKRRKEKVGHGRGGGGEGGASRPRPLPTPWGGGGGGDVVCSPGSHQSEAAGGRGIPCRRGQKPLSESNDESRRRWWRHRRRRWRKRRREPQHGPGIAAGLGRIILVRQRVGPRGQTTSSGWAALQKVRTGDVIGRLASGASVVRRWRRHSGTERRVAAADAHVIAAIFFSFCGGDGQRRRQQLSFRAAASALLFIAAGAVDANIRHHVAQASPSQAGPPV